MTQDNILIDKSIDFAIRMTSCYKYLMEEKNEFIMSKQMFRSGTSIGANIHEGVQAQSKADFVSKLGIALNIELDSIIRILVASIKTTKKNMAK